jgi:hypothetical protein
MRAINKKSGITLIVISLIVLYLSLAMFTPAILVTLFLLFLAGFYAFHKFYKIAAALFLINAAAVYFYIDLIMQSGQAFDY